MNKHDDKNELKIINKKFKDLDLITNNEYDDISYLVKDSKEKNLMNKKMTEKNLKNILIKF